MLITEVLLFKMYPNCFVCPYKITKNAIRSIFSKEYSVVNKIKYIIFIMIDIDSNIKTHVIRLLPIDCNLYELFPVSL